MIVMIPEEERAARQAETARVANGVEESPSTPIESLRGISSSGWSCRIGKATACRREQGERGLHMQTGAKSMDARRRGHGR